MAMDYSEVKFVNYFPPVAVRLTYDRNRCLPTYKNYNVPNKMEIKSNKTYFISQRVHVSWGRNNHNIHLVTVV